nr:unnamed protein product [Callosobruchus chinensis]
MLTHSASDQITPRKPGLKKRSNRKRQSRSKAKKADNTINQNFFENIWNTGMKASTFIDDTQMLQKNWPGSGISGKYLDQKSITNIDINCYSVQQKMMDIKFMSYSNQISSGYNLIDKNLSKSLSRSFQSMGRSPPRDEDSSYSENQSDSELFFFDITGDYSQDQSNTSQNKASFSKIYNCSLSLAESCCSNEEKDVTQSSNTTESDYTQNSISFNQFNFDDLRDSSETSEEEVVLEELNEIDRPIEDHCVELTNDSDTIDDDLPIKKEKVEEKYSARENSEISETKKGNASNDYSSKSRNGTFFLESDEDPSNDMKCNRHVLAVEESMSELESDYGHRVNKAPRNSVKHIEDQKKHIYSQIIDDSSSSSDAEQYETNQNIFKTDYEKEVPYDIQEMQDIQNIDESPGILVKTECNNDSSMIFDAILETNGRESQNNVEVQGEIQTIDSESEKADFWPKILYELKIQKKLREQSTSPEKVKKTQAVDKNHKIMNNIEAVSKITKKRKFKNDTGNIQLLREILRTKRIKMEEGNDFGTKKKKLKKSTEIIDKNETGSSKSKKNNRLEDPGNSKLQYTEVYEENIGSEDGNIECESKVSPSSKTKKKKLKKVTTDPEMIQGTKVNQNIYADSEIPDKNVTSSSKSKKNKHLDDTGNSELQRGEGIEYTEVYEENVDSQSENIEFETKESPTFKMKKKKLKKSTSDPERTQDIEVNQNMYADSEILDENRTNSSKSKKNKHLEDTGNSELQHGEGIEYTEVYEENVDSQSKNIEFETKESPTFKMKKKKLKKSTSDPERTQDIEVNQNMYADSEILDENRTNSSKSKKNKHLEDTGNSELQRGEGIEYTEVYEENVDSQSENIEFETKESPTFKMKKKKLKKSTSDPEVIQDIEVNQNIYADSEILDKNRTNSSKSKKNKHLEDTGNSELQRGEVIEYTEVYEENVDSQSENIEFEPKDSPTFEMKKKKLKKSTSDPEMIQDIEVNQNMYAGSEILDKTRTDSLKSKEKSHLEDTRNSELQHGKGVEYTEEENVESQTENIEFETKESPTFEIRKKKLKKNTSDPEMIQDIEVNQNIYADSEILDKNRTNSSKSKKNRHLEDTGNSEMQHRKGVEYTEEENVESKTENIKFETKESPTFKTKKKKLKKNTSHAEVIQDIEVNQNMYDDSQILFNNRTNSSKSKKNSQLEDTGDSELQQSEVKLESNITDTEDINAAGKELEAQSNAAVTKKKKKNRKDMLTDSVSYLEVPEDHPRERVSISGLQDKTLICSDNHNEEIGDFGEDKYKSQREHEIETELLENILQKRRNLLEELQKNVDTSEVTKNSKQRIFKKRTSAKLEELNSSTTSKNKLNHGEKQSRNRFQNKQSYPADSVELISDQISKEIRSMQVNKTQFKWSDLKEMASKNEPKKVRKKKCQKFIDIINSDCEMDVTYNGTDNESLKIADKDNDQPAYSEYDTKCKEFVDIVDSDCTMETTLINIRKKKKNKKNNEGLKIADRDHDQVVYSEEDTILCKEFVDIVDSDCTMKTTLTSTRQRKRNKKSNEGLKIADRDTDQVFGSQENDSICNEFADIVDTECTTEMSLANSRKGKGNKKSKEGLKTADRDTDQAFCSEKNDKTCKEFVDIVDSDCSMETSLSNSRKKKKNKKSNEDLKTADRDNDQGFYSGENDSICKEFVDIVDSDCTMETTLTSPKKRKRNKKSNEGSKIADTDDQIIAHEKNDSIHKKVVDTVDSNCTIKTSLTDSRKKKNCENSNAGLTITDKDTDNEETDSMRKEFVGIVDIDSTNDVSRNKNEDSQISESRNLRNESIGNSIEDYECSNQVQLKSKNNIDSADHVRKGEDTSQVSLNGSELIKVNFGFKKLLTELNKKRKKRTIPKTEIIPQTQESQNIDAHSEIPERKLFDDNGILSSSNSQQMQKQQTRELKKASDTNKLKKTADQTSPKVPCASTKELDSGKTKSNNTKLPEENHIRRKKKTKHSINEVSSKSSDECSLNLKESISRHVEANEHESELQEKGLEISYVQTDTDLQEGQDIKLKQEKNDSGSKKFFKLNVKQKKQTTSKTEIILEKQKTHNIDSNSQTPDRKLCDENKKSTVNFNKGILCSSTPQHSQNNQAHDSGRASDKNILEETAEQTSPNVPRFASTKELNSGKTKSNNTKSPEENHLRREKKTKHSINEPSSKSSDKCSLNLKESISRHVEANQHGSELQEKELEISHVQTNADAQERQDVKLKQEKIDSWSKTFFKLNVKKKKQTTSKTEINLETQTNTTKSYNTKLPEDNISIRKEKKTKHSMNEPSSKNSDECSPNLESELQEKELEIRHIDTDTEAQEEQNHDSEKALDKNILEKTTDQTGPILPSSVSSEPNEHNKEHKLDEKAESSSLQGLDEVKVETPEMKRPYGNRDALIKKIYSWRKGPSSKHSNNEKEQSDCSTNDLSMSEMGNRSSNKSGDFTPSQLCETWEDETGLVDRFSFGKSGKRSKSFQSDNGNNDSVSEDKFDPKELSLSVPFSVPPIHEHLADAKQEAEAAKLGITLRKGPFTKEEDKQILDNWTYFCLHHDLKVKPEDFFDIKKIRTVERIKFLQFLAQGLDRRQLHRVHMRFKRMFVKKHVRTGRFTAEEDAQIIDYLKNTTSNTPFRELGDMFNRTNVSVQRRYDTLIKAKNTGRVEWNVRSIAKLVSKLMHIKRAKDINDLKEAEITTEEWKILSQKLDYIPVERLRRAWKVTIYPRLFAESADLAQMKKDIIKTLYECDINDWRLIDWKSIAEKYPGFTSQNVYHMFRQTMNHHVPKEKHEDVKECLSYLMHNVIEKNKFKPPYALKRFIAELSEESSASENDAESH